METDIYIEIVKGTDRWDVIAPSHQYNPSLQYDEIAISCEYKIEEITDDGAYLSGGEIHEYSHSLGSRKVLSNVTGFKSTQGTRITFDQKLVGDLEQEAERIISQ
jgi:hypothetical protein